MLYLAMLYLASKVILTFMCNVFASKSVFDRVL